MIKELERRMDLQSEKLDVFNKEKYKEQPNKDEEYNK